MDTNKTLKIQVPNGFEIDKEKSTFKEIIFREIESKLPKTWKELRRVKGFYFSGVQEKIRDCDVQTTVDSSLTINEFAKCVFPTKELAEAALALAQLLQLRDAYNATEKSDWTSIVYVINVFYGDITIDEYSDDVQFVMSFKTEELCDEFYENFKDLLETAKPLLFSFFLLVLMVSFGLICFVISISLSGF